MEVLAVLLVYLLIKTAKTSVAIKKLHIITKTAETSIVIKQLLETTYQ